MIQPGSIEQVRAESGDWVFVDIGFSRTARTCGILEGDGKAVEVTFAELRRRITDLTSRRDERQLNLLIEAPLSVAFDAQGNPTGRSIERRDSDTRYWYVGLGCTVLVATMHLLRHVVDSGVDRDVHLFEGFVSFKRRDQRSSHAADVESLRNVVWSRNRVEGAVLDAKSLRRNKGDVLESAFKVAGMDFGVPPVVRG